MFAPPPPPAFTLPGSLLVSAGATLSVIACADIIMRERVKSQGYSRISGKGITEIRLQLSGPGKLPQSGLTASQPPQGGGLNGSM